MINHYDLIAVKTEPGTIAVIRVAEIISLSAAGNYVEIFFKEGRLLHRATLQSLLRRMPEQFVQIHRSHVINLHHLKLVQSELGRYTECVMADGQQLPIGAQFKTELMKGLNLTPDETSD
ncbi:MAG: LytTR family DNA-binding domain-containing protein [Idiomarina sp.]